MVTFTWLIVVYFCDCTGNTRFSHLWKSSWNNMDHYQLCCYDHQSLCTHCTVPVSCYHVLLDTVHVQILIEDSVEATNWNPNFLCNCFYCWCWSGHTTKSSL